MRSPSPLSIALLAAWCVGAVLLCASAIGGVP